MRQSKWHLLQAQTTMVAHMADIHFYVYWPHANTKLKSRR